MQQRHNDILKKIIDRQLETLRILWHFVTDVFHHVGVYAYTGRALKSYATWKLGVLERLEGLEQLRFLENGAKINCVEVDAKGRQFWELNNPEDVPKIEAMLAEMGLE